VSNMNGPTRKKLYAYVSKRDGGYCKGCGALSSERSLVLDHIDNNNANNHPSNHQLLCRRCNYLKNPRRPFDNVNECVTDGDAREIEISKIKEPSFRKFVYHELNESNEVPESDLVNSAAEDIGISPVTAKRYLNKMCSSRGICERSCRVNAVVIRYKSGVNEL